MEFDKTAVNLGTFARSKHLPSCFKKRLRSSIFTRIKYLPHTFTNWINNPRITHSSQHPLSELCTQIQNESNLTILSLSGVLNDKKSKCQELFSCARSLPQFPARLLTRVLKREINKVNTWLWFFSQVSFVMSCTFSVNFFPVPVDVRYASKIPISISLLSGSCIWRQNMRAIRDCFENPSVSPYSKFDLS